MDYKYKPEEQAERRKEREAFKVLKKHLYKVAVAPYRPAADDPAGRARWDALNRVYRLAIRADLASAGN